MPASATPPICAAPPGDVLLDTRIDAGALEFVLRCLGPGAAHAVRVRFSRRIRDLAGLSVNDNPLFSRLEFLAPGRELVLLVDSFDGYRRRRQPERFDVRITWRDDAGEPRRRDLTHDLGAWAGLRQRL